MVYIAIDDKSKKAKKLIEFLELEEFTTIYKEPNKTTKKALRDAKSGKGVEKISNVSEWFSKVLKK